MNANPKLTLCRRYEFSASHRLQAGEMHACSRLHGHNYEVEICVSRGDHDVWLGPGWVIDTRVLDSVWEAVAVLYDHVHLNESLGEDSPTVEILARRLFRDFASELGARNLDVALVSVEVAEGWRTRARYRA